MKIYQAGLTARGCDGIKLKLLTAEAAGSNHFLYSYGQNAQATFDFFTNEDAPPLEEIKPNE